MRGLMDIQMDSEREVESIGVKMEEKDSNSIWKLIADIHFTGWKHLIDRAVLQIRMWAFFTLISIKYL